MKLLLLSGVCVVTLLGCSSRIEQVASGSEEQWLCDANPATGKWDCRRLAIGEVPPLPAALAVKQTPQRSVPGVMQKTLFEQASSEHALPEQTVSEQLSLSVPSHPTQEITETVEPAAPEIAGQAVDATPAQGYVVQLAALSNRAAVTRFIDEQQISQEPLTWHRTYSQGRHWYVVTTEPINSHVQALATAGRLEGDYPGLATWVRSLHSLQQVIDH